MNFLSVGTKKGGSCREVTFSGGSTVRTWEGSTDCNQSLIVKDCHT